MRNALQTRVDAQSPEPRVAIITDEQRPGTLHGDPCPLPLQPLVAGGGRKGLLKV